MNIENPTSSKIAFSLRPTNLGRHSDTHRLRRVSCPRLNFVDARFHKADSRYHPVTAAALRALPSILADVVFALWALESSLELALFQLRSHP